MLIDVIKVLLPITFSFILGIILTPALTNYLYKHKMWKKQSVRKTIDGQVATISASIHNDEQKKTPRMGGIIVWLSATLTTLGIWTWAALLPGELSVKLDFLSRNQTWIPLMTLLVGALVGLIDDYLVTREGTGNSGEYIGGGLSLSKRLFTITALGLFCGYWFYSKLGVISIGSDSTLGSLDVGIWLIPIFAIISLAVYSGGVIDGLDGLAGGVFASSFAAYGVIAFSQNQINLAAFCAAILGGILAFLWFNIPPARYYLSETGTMALTITLTVVAFMTDNLGGGHGILVLPIIALPLVLSSGSVILQLLSKKFRGRKLFLVAPLHHHFEAIGWPSGKVVMRYWIISVITAILGVIIILASQ